MVLQALEGLSDRDAARALADRISWKVATGLPLDDAGFHHTVLTYWRARLRASERPERIFDAVRQVVDATGVLRGRTRRALDSTLLDDAVAAQDTVTQLISQIRRVRREVPAASSVKLHAHDYEGGVPARLPTTPTHGGALLGMARRRRSSTGPLPRGHKEPVGAPPPGGSDQPATDDQPRPGPLGGGSSNPPEPAPADYGRSHPASLHSERGR